MPLGHAHGGVHKINNAAAREETGVENFEHTVIDLDRRAAEAEFAAGPGGKSSNMNQRLFQRGGRLQQALFVGQRSNPFVHRL